MRRDNEIYGFFCGRMGISAVQKKEVTDRAINSLRSDLVLLIAKWRGFSSDNQKAPNKYYLIRNHSYNFDNDLKIKKEQEYFLDFILNNIEKTHNYNTDRAGSSIQ